MTQSNQLVAFSLDDQSYALDLSCVERIVRAVHVTHLPDAPETVHGVIDVEGRIIPVVNTRKRLGLPEREIDLDDRFIIARENGLAVALVADDVTPVLEMSTEWGAGSGETFTGKSYIQGVAKSDQGMVMILKIERTLSSEDQELLSAAIGGLSEEQND